MSIYRLVTLAEAKANGRITSTGEDSYLQDLVDDASRIIMNYLESAWARVRQYSGDDDVSGEFIAESEKAFGGWTDSNGIPLVDSNGDPLIVDFNTDSNGDPINADSNGNPTDGRSIIPADVRRATFVAIEAMNRDRTGEAITPAVKALLVRFRPPTVA